MTRFFLLLAACATNIALVSQIDGPWIFASIFISFVLGGELGVASITGKGR